MPLIEYSKWQNFEIVIDKAKETCKNSENLIENHFTEVGKMVEIGSKTSRKVGDYKLSRYACGKRRDNFK